MNQSTEPALKAGEKLVNGSFGVLRAVDLTPAPPDEPEMYHTVVERSHPDELTDGHEFSPSEGGGSLDREKAIVSAIGEGVERYCSCIYRAKDLRKETYDDIENGIDPADVVNFSDEQIASGDAPASLYTDDSEIRWVESRRVSDGADVFVPAQLVYLNYDRSSEPFIRNPISTGLAAGMDNVTATIQGILEVVERDAFMVYYLTKTPLSKIDLQETTDSIDLLTDRLDRKGIDWYLFDARTDVGIPVVISVLVDVETPTVTVAADAGIDILGAVRGALEEALQTRLYQRHIISNGESPIRFEDVERESINRDRRILGWSHEDAPDELAFWTESDRTTAVEKIRAETEIDDVTRIPEFVDRTLNLYTVDITTRDVAEAGFSVVRAIAPEAQPLYLREEHRYWDTTRLESVPEQRGHRTEIPENEPINDYPHPFP